MRRKLVVEISVVRARAEEAADSRHDGVKKCPHSP
jgi:hypothetical protein